MTVLSVSQYNTRHTQALKRADGIAFLVFAVSVSVGFLLLMSI